MNEKVIKAVSFFYEGERHIVKSSINGKFRVPVTEVIEGRGKTTNKSLTAKQLLDHKIIKECDPTFYLQDGKKHRVFHGGDSSYLPAESEGLAVKHDEANKPRKIPKLSFGKQKTIDKPVNNGYNNCEQAGLWEWPYADDYHD